MPKRRTSARKRGRPARYAVEEEEEVPPQPSLKSFSSSDSGDEMPELEEMPTEEIGGQQGVPHKTTIELDTSLLEKWLQFCKLPEDWRPESGKIPSHDGEPPDGGDSSDVSKKEKKDHNKKKAKSLDSSDSGENMKDLKVLSRVIIFDGNNYAVWKLYVEGILTPKKLWSIVCGTEERPSDPSGAKRWDLRDMVAKTTLFQCTDSSIHEHFLTKKTSSEYWQALQNLYEKSFSSKLGFVYKEFSAFVMKNEETIDGAIRRFNVLIEKLNSLGKFPPEDEKLFTFLNGLPARYNFSVEVIYARDNPNFEFAINHLKSSESMWKKEQKGAQQFTTNGESVEAYAFKGGRGGSSLKGKGEVTCYKCGKKGHFSSECRGKETRECFKCHKTGHLSPDCDNDEEGAANTFKDGSRGSQRGRGRGRGRGKGRGGQSRKANYTESKDDNEDAYDFTVIMNDEVSTLNAGTSGKTENSWIIDSGATHHLCSDLSMFAETSKLVKPRSITVASGDSVQIDKVGTVKLLLPVKENGVETVNKVKLSNVLYLPGGATNLLSVPQIQKNGGRVTCYENGKITLTDHTGHCFGEGHITSSMHSILSWRLPRKSKISVNSASAEKSLERGDLDLWHYRLCHTSEANIKRMILINAVRGLECASGEKVNNCDGCTAGKQKRLSHPVKDVDYRSSQPLDLIHIDLCGPIKPQSLGGQKYIFVLIDDYSRKSWVYLLSLKNDAVHKFREFVKIVERETDKKVKKLRSDNGGEFLGEFAEFCNELGIKQQFTSAYSPQSNGVAERKNRTLQEMVRAMIATSGAKSYLWGEAILAANYITNRRLTSVSAEKTPEELYRNHKPSVAHVRIWGCDVTVYVEERYRNGKFGRRSWRGILVGYSSQSNQYRIFDPEGRHVYESRNVYFHENLSGVQNTSNESRPFDSIEICSDGESDEGLEGDNVEENRQTQKTGDTKQPKGGTKRAASKTQEVANKKGDKGEKDTQTVRRSSRESKGKGPDRLTYEDGGVQLRNAAADTTVTEDS
jgi:gag-polypeptide of LTR copia-type/Integrase core domain/GAG-pre-integrase domain/Zinc knuckle